MDYHGRRVVVTGGAGFIGSHLASELIRRGAAVMIIDNLDEFYPRVWKRANLEDVGKAGAYEFAEADICDAEVLRQSLIRARPDAVIHLAARAGVRPSIEQPALYEKVNVAGTLNVLEACKELGVPQFIFGSSSSVYGSASHAPFSENQVDMKPISPYAATKLSGELICYTYAHLYGLQIACLRFFTVYGPRQRPDLAIHKFVALLESGNALPVFGDGSMGRDYTYVTDTVAGILAALDYGPPKKNGIACDVFNLGNSRPVTLADLIQTLEQVTGRKAKLDRRPLQAGDVPLTWADLSKSEKLLGYRPAVSLRDGLAAFVRWYREADTNRKA